jgi:Flp pilus assembly protein TadB
MSGATPALLALGSALLLGGGPGRSRSRPSHAAGERPAGPSPATLRLAAVLASIVLGIAMLGPLRGAVVGVALGVLAGVVIGRLGPRVDPKIDLERLPLVLDLLAAVLRCGQPLTAALAAVAPTAEPVITAELMRVAGLLQLGAEPAIAWTGIANYSDLQEVAAAAERSADSGIRLADGFERVAADLRSRVSAVGLARAQRAAVWAMAPLGLCFLPAFVCVGVIPVVVGIAQTAFGGLGW